MADDDLQTYLGRAYELLRKIAPNSKFGDVGRLQLDLVSAVQQAKQGKDVIEPYISSENSVGNLYRYSRRPVNALDFFDRAKIRYDRLNSLASGGGSNIPPGGTPPSTPSSGGSGSRYDWDTLFKRLPGDNVDREFFRGAGYGSLSPTENIINGTLIPLLGRRQQYRAEQDVPIQATEKGRQLFDLYKKAFNDNTYFLDLETTANAQKDDAARIFQATLYRQDPTVRSENVKHFVTDNLHALEDLSKTRGLKPGEALTFYFRLDPKHSDTDFIKHKLGTKITYFDENEKEVTHTLGRIVHKKGTDVAEHESRGIGAILEILGRATAQKQNGAALYVHNSDFDFSQLQLAFLRDRRAGGNLGENVTRAFPTAYAPKGSMRVAMEWNRKAKEKGWKAFNIDEEEFFDKRKNKAIYRMYAESNVETDNLVRIMEQQARVARRAKTVLEKNKAMKESATTAQQFVETYLANKAKHLGTAKTRVMLHDTTHLLKASNVLLQKHGYYPSRGNIALGTSLDLLGIAKEGIPFSHIESKDIARYSEMISNEYENIILPLLSNGKLNLEGKRQVFVRKRLMEIDNEKNIADSIFERYLEAIEKQKIQVTGEIGLKAEPKSRVNMTMGEIIEEHVNFYAQPHTVRTSKILDKPIRESLEAEHGKDQADIIQRYIEKIDKEYQKKYYHDMSATVVREEGGDVLFEKAGYGSGEFQTIPFKEMRETIKNLRQESRESFQILKTVEGANLSRMSHAMTRVGIDPNKAERVIDVFNAIRPAFTSVDKQIAQMRDQVDHIMKANPEALSHSVVNRVFDNAIDGTGKTKSILRDYITKRTMRGRTGVAVGGLLALSALAAKSRASKTMQEDIDQKDFQARFDYYLGETGASINADGSSGYEGDVLSAEDRESYSSFDSLNVYEKAINTDFQSPFKSPSVSLPMAKEKSSNNVKQISVDKPHMGYNVKGGNGILSELNKQAQMANHRRLQGHYNMLQTDYNLDG